MQWYVIFGIMDHTTIQKLKDVYERTLKT